MSSVWNFLFASILIILWIISGAYVTQASIFLTDFSDTDDYLHRAYWLTFWAAFTTWGLIAIFIILVILSVIGLVALFGSGAGEAEVAASEAEEAYSISNYQNLATSSNINTGISWFTLGFFVLALILVTITGVLAAISASSINSSPNFYQETVRLVSAYHDCIIGASLCIGSASILLIGIVIYFIIGIRRTNEHNKQLAEISGIRHHALQERLIQDIQAKQLEQRAIRANNQQALINQTQPGYQPEIIQQRPNTLQQRPNIQQVYQQPPVNITQLAQTPITKSSLQQMALQGLYQHFTT